ncbi:U6 snRNA phosphodiesterase Usb1 [Aspergillus avenaceus]|uniref:U6 snRNA phosphodiesterase n=1 Tax=Aspergillus avenaceus TaxID=36643 RepID=A0A5N6U5P8_ASPAV|nr:U6 snRNA phosphodiesterase Usb1 [Aspergillus avenaceus]
MALVQYSDSESEDSQGESVRPPAKKQRPERTPLPEPSLPPLPKAFHDLYASSTRISVKDDPSLHGGRKRAIPHVEGNWPTHIYLEWYPLKQELTVLSDVIEQIEQKRRRCCTRLNSLLRSDLGAQLPLHISLSRPVVLRTEQRYSFMDTLRSAIRGSKISTFDAQFEGLDCVSNYERTRWFFVLRVKKPEGDALNRLLRLSNQSLAPFGQPPLYESSAHVVDATTSPIGSMQWQQGATPHTPKDYSHCFHISVAWTLAEPSPEEREQISNLDLREINGLAVGFDCVKAKIGNNITSIPLSNGVD